MPKWKQSAGSPDQYGTVSFGTDTDQSLVVDPWQLDTNGVLRLAAPGAPSYDTTIQRTAAGAISINGTPVGAASAVAGAGATVTGVTAETILASGLTVAANTLAAGQVYRFVATGTITTTVDTQTIDLRLRFGGLTGTLIFDFGSQNPDASATITGAAWSAEFDVIATTNGNLVVRAQDALNYFPSAVGNSSTAVTNTVAEQFVLTVQPSATALSMTCSGFYCERVV